MPRKAFIADLQKAVGGVVIAGISDVQPGNDDGEFTFLVKSATNGGTLELSALIPDVSEYPSSHTCMFFAPDNAPNKVAQALSDLSDSAPGKNIIQLLELVAKSLESTDRDGDTQMLDSGDDFQSNDEDEEEEEDDYSADEYFPDDDVVPQSTFGKSETSNVQSHAQPTSVFRNRIRMDLMTAKGNGFKIGHLGSLMDGLGCYVSISCRISKLGISEEAMQAWQIDPSEYLILIIHYPSGYKSIDSLKSYDAQTARRHIGMRIGISSSYKPTMQEAVRAFTTMSKDEEKRRDDTQGESQDLSNRGFRNSFISCPLNELLNERLITLIEYRYMGMPWSGAEDYYNDHYGTNIENSDSMNDKYMEVENVSASFPGLVTADHIREAGTDQSHSFPLIAMQFVLRHFVRCTEFCLVCFCKMQDDLEAIKPYVCDKPLCLYQYMSLGFGPSIEHEIIAQPKVVDLLISFCYASARQGGLKDFPTGLSLMVPPFSAFENEQLNQSQTANYPYNFNQPAVAPPSPAANTTTGAGEPGKMRFNYSKLEMIFDDPNQKVPFRTGDWVVIRTSDNPMKSLHCRIVETTFFPTIKVSEPIVPSSAIPVPSIPTIPGQAKPPAPPVPSTFTPATFYIYNQNFDDLHEFYKRQTIYSLLETLPSVANMKQYLIRKAQSGLNTWVDHLSPATLGMLRWIIASNRACIIQVEDCRDSDPKAKKGEERLYGMNGWMQFRFAMGAPDKERRFINSVRSTTDRLKLKYPTLFAWHGSPLQNWHSIIREGLHFNFTAHGRAYGHGVYHSLDVHTSLGYTGMGYTSTSSWPQSELKVNSAMALNEIVNAPKEFVSSTPHLVVAQLDWIQTRYLFVKGAQADSKLNEADVKPLQVHEQDPAMTPRGQTDKVVIPITAVSCSRRPQSLSVKTGSKRVKASGKNIYDPIVLDGEDDDSASVCTLDEDIAIFIEEEVQPDPHPESQISSGKGKGKATSFFSKLVGSSQPKDSKPPKPLTDFVPGSLEHSNLPMLEPPAWATPSATKRLQQDFKTLLKVQNSEPLHELGWYIDPELVTNMYQWIVELHSFESHLPLAKDMKSKGTKSIIMELRFGKDYPMSPPFVRVIRPRFLGFQQGGGGHVTAGGALCMELLTNNGWSAVSSIESVLLQVRLAMSSLDPKPARLENGPPRDYYVGEAVEAYVRACNTHGWTVPAGFREMAYGGAPNQGSAYSY